MKYVDCSAPVREYLCQADPVLGAHIQRIGELYRPMKDDLFTALCSSIISQLISKKSAATVYNRLTEKCGGAITPQALAELTPEEIQKCGMSMRKADNLSRIAHSVLGGGNRPGTPAYPVRSGDCAGTVRPARCRGVDGPDADDLCHGASGCHQL